MFRHACLPAAISSTPGLLPMQAFCFGGMSPTRTPGPSPPTPHKKEGTFASIWGRGWWTGRMEVGGWWGWWEGQAWGGMDLPSPPHPLACLPQQHILPSCLPACLCPIAASPTTCYAYHAMPALPACLPLPPAFLCTFTCLLCLPVPTACLCLLPPHLPASHLPASPLLLMLWAAARDTCLRWCSICGVTTFVAWWRYRWHGKIAYGCICTDNLYRMLLYLCHVWRDAVAGTALL